MNSNWLTDLFINEAKPAMKRHNGGDTGEADALRVELATANTTISEQASTINDLNEDLETANSTIATKTSELETANAAISEKDTMISEQSTQITELETWKSENLFASEMLNARLQTKNWMYVFANCETLTWVPLLDTSKVTTMNYTFANCEKLTSIPLFDTSNVTSMGNAFASCFNLASFPLLNTSKVTNMSYMVFSCTGLTSFPLLDTRKVTNASSMFNNCHNLVTVPQLDFRAATNLNNIVGVCNKLENCYLRNIKTNLQVGSGTSWGHLLTLDSLKHLIYELRDTGSLKTLTVGSANLEKLANVYVKFVEITDEMRAEDDLIDEKLPVEVCESTDEGAMLITNYVAEKNWTLK